MALSLSIHTIDEEQGQQEVQATNNADHDDDVSLTVINLNDDDDDQHGGPQQGVPTTAVDLDNDDDDEIPIADAIELVEEGTGGGVMAAATREVSTTIPEVTTTVTTEPSLPLTMIASEASTRRMNLIEAIGEAIGKPLYPSSSTDESESCDSNDSETRNNINARRPEFVSATIIEKPAATKMGLRLSENEEDRTIRIVEIEADSALSKSPLRKGDVLLSISGKRCTGLETAKVAAMLTEASGTVTLVARNLLGNASRVESMFQKADPESSVGMTLVRRRGGGGSLQISRLAKTGIAVNSLLNPGDRVLSINGVRCEGLSAVQAKELIQRADRDVTVLGQVRTSRGVVVSAASARSNRTAASGAGASTRSSMALHASALAGEQRATATALDNNNNNSRRSSLSWSFAGGGGVIPDEQSTGDVPWRAVFLTMMICFVMLTLTRLIK